MHIIIGGVTRNIDQVNQYYYNNPLPSNDVNEVLKESRASKLYLKEFSKRTDIEQQEFVGGTKDYILIPSIDLTCVSKKDTKNSAFHTECKYASDAEKLSSRTTILDQITDSGEKQSKQNTDY